MYEVQVITDRRINPATKKTEYLVKWAGHPETNNSWEPEQNLCFVQYLIQDFNKKSNIHSSSSKDGKNTIIKSKYFGEQDFEIAKGKIFEESEEEEGEKSPIRGKKSGSDLNYEKNKKKKDEEGRGQLEQRRKNTTKKKINSNTINESRPEYLSQTQNPFSKLPSSFNSFNQKYLQRQPLKTPEENNYSEFSSLCQYTPQEENFSSRQQFWTQNPDTLYEKPNPKEGILKQGGYQQIQNCQIKFPNSKSKCIPSHFSSRGTNIFTESLFDRQGKLNLLGEQITTMKKKSKYDILEILNMEKAGGQFYYLTKTSEGNLWLQRNDVFPMYATELCEFYEKNLTFENS